jgi:hypothetical protein
MLGNESAPISEMEFTPGVENWGSKTMLVDLSINRGAFYEVMEHQHQHLRPSEEDWAKATKWEHFDYIAACCSDFEVLDAS